MASEKEKTVKFVTKLLRQTQDGTIEWTPTSAPGEEGKAAFVTRIGGKRLRIYPTHEEIYEYPYLDTGFSFSNWRQPKPEKRIISVTVMELLDGDLVTYTFNDTAGLGDLYANASFSASKVEDLMDAVLGEEKDEREATE